MDILSSSFVTQAKRPDDRSTMSDARRRAAFDALYGEYSQRVYAFCLRMMRDPDKAKDVFQEICVKAYKTLDTIREDGKTHYWLFALARNECLNALVRQTRELGRHAVLSDELENKSPGDASLLEHRNLIAWAIKQLPDEMREALLLAEYEGFHYDEIAAITGASLATVKVRICRAKAKLRIILQPILSR